MNALDFVVFGAAVATMLAYLCRIDMLVYGLPLVLVRVVRGQPRSGHKLAIIMLHAFLASACIFSGVDAWEGKAAPLHLFAVVGAALWIVVSFNSWRKSVPAHFDSGPVPLDEKPLGVRA